MKNRRSNANNTNSTLERFLTEINRILAERDAARLLDYLVIEPPYPASYTEMIAELRRDFPSRSADGDNTINNTGGQRRSGDAGLESLCERKLRDVLSSDAAATTTITSGGSTGTGMGWSAFGKFMVQYFVFLREVDVRGRNLLET